MRLIDADALPRHGQRGGLVHWKDIENAPTIDAADVIKKMFDGGIQLTLSEDFESTQTKELIDKIVESLETMERDMRTLGNCEKANGVSSAIWLIKKMAKGEEDE